MICLNKLVKQQIAGVLFYNPVKIFKNDLPVHTKIATNHQIEKKPSQNQKFEAVFLFLLFWKNVIEKIFSDFFEPLPFF